MTVTHWLLIYWLVMGNIGSYGGVNATTNVASFYDETSCKAAFAAMRKAKNADQGLWGVCVSASTAEHQP